jgi:hypothetical protein
MERVLTIRQRDLIPRGLFELPITFAENDDLRDDVKALAVGFGGDPRALLYEPPGQ